MINGDGGFPRWVILSSRPASRPDSPVLLFPGTTVGRGARRRKIQLKLIDLPALSVEVGQRKGDALIPTRSIQLANVKRKAAFLKVIVLPAHRARRVVRLRRVRWRLLIGMEFQTLRLRMTMTTASR